MRANFSDIGTIPGSDALVAPAFGRTGLTPVKNFIPGKLARVGAARLNYCRDHHLAFYYFGTKATGQTLLPGWKRYYSGVSRNVREFTGIGCFDCQRNRRRLDGCAQHVWVNSVLGQLRHTSVRGRS